MYYRFRNIDGSLRSLVIRPRPFQKLRTKEIQTNKETSTVHHCFQNVEDSVSKHQELVEESCHSNHDNTNTETLPKEKVMEEKACKSVNTSVALS